MNFSLNSATQYLCTRLDESIAKEANKRNDMESINSVYLDNSVVRELIENPEMRIDLFDDFCRHIGRCYQPIQKYMA